MNSIHQSPVSLISANAPRHGSLPPPYCKCGHSLDQPLIRLHVQTKPGFATHKSLEDWPLLVMMPLHHGACYCVMDCISITLAAVWREATCFMLQLIIAWLFSTHSELRISDFSFYGNGEWHPEEVLRWMSLEPLSLLLLWPGKWEWRRK